MTLYKSLISASKSISLLFLASISTNSFADRNPNTAEVCAKFNIDSAKEVQTEITFTAFKNAERTVYKTYYKDENSSYYNSEEDRQNKRLRMTPRGDVVVRPLKDITPEQYKEFFKTCGIYAEDDLLEFGFYQLTTGFDPVSAAKALEDSEWFETSYPPFITHLTGCC